MSSLREEQERSFLAILGENGTELTLPGGSVHCHIARIDDVASRGESYTTRARGLEATCLTSGMPQHGDEFTFEGWLYVVNSVSTRPGSTLAKFTAVAVHAV